MITFNEGSMGRAKVLHEMGITPGCNAISGFLQSDNLRIKKGEKAILEITKEARQKRRARKRKKEEEEAGDNASYGPCLLYTSRCV